MESVGVRYPPGMDREQSNVHPRFLGSVRLTCPVHICKAGLTGAEAKEYAESIPVSSYAFILRLKLETGSPRLAYLNKSIIVASANRTPDAVAYDAYIVEQGSPRQSKL